MRRLNFLLTAVLTYSAAVSAVGQITERQRPVEWANLVRGGRFMDRFEAMPDGNLRADVWGADSVRPRFVDNGIERPDLSFWGGNIVRGDDGRYHLFVCGWPERSEKGHMTWPASTVYHTTSTRPWGPYTIADTIGKGHNPEVYRTDDGRYVLFTLADYGQFHIWHRSSDLYIKDVQTGDIRPLSAVNSETVDSNHSWSSNGRWIAVSSRRDDGSYSRVFIAYFDKNGNAHKAFMLPQEDPEHNTLRLKSYNLPEFSKNAVQMSAEELQKVVYNDDIEGVKYSGKIQ